jgi:hypothetical protein
MRATSTSEALCTTSGWICTKSTSTGGVLDSQGVVVAEQRRLPPVLEAVLGWLAQLGQPVAVALEATLSWAWLYVRLAARGYQVVNRARTPGETDLSRARQTMLRGARG